MTMDSMSAADIAAVTRPYGMGMGWGCGGFGGGFGYGNDWLAILVLFALFGGGFGGGFGGAGANGLGAVYGAQQFSQLDNGIRSIQNGICDSTFALNNSVKDGFYSVNSNISSALCNTTYELASKIDANRFAAQQCCCETQRAIDGVNYNNAKNTCDIVNAIHAEGNATRDLIIQNKIEMLQSKITELTNANNAKNLALSQFKQNQYLLNEFEEKFDKKIGCGCGYYAD